MPKIFKVLASISVWILFIFGCLSLLGGFIRIFLGSGQNSLPLIATYFGYGILSITFSVLVALMRRKMD